MIGAHHAIFGSAISALLLASCAETGLESVSRPALTDEVKRTLIRWAEDPAAPLGRMPDLEHGPGVVFARLLQGPETRASAWGIQPTWANALREAIASCDIANAGPFDCVEVGFAHSFEVADIDVIREGHKAALFGRKGLWLNTGKRIRLTTPTSMVIDNRTFGAVIRDSFQESGVARPEMREPGRIRAFDYDAIRVLLPKNESRSAVVGVAPAVFASRPKSLSVDAWDAAVAEWLAHRVNDAGRVIQGYRPSALRPMPNSSLLSELITVWCWLEWANRTDESSAMLDRAKHWVLSEECQAAIRAGNKLGVTAAAALVGQALGASSAQVTASHLRTIAEHVTNNAVDSASSDQRAGNAHIHRGMAALALANKNNSAGHRSVARRLVEQGALTTAEPGAGQWMAWYLMAAAQLVQSGDDLPPDTRKRLTDSCERLSQPRPAVDADYRWSGLLGDVTGNTFPASSLVGLLGAALCDWSAATAPDSLVARAKTAAHYLQSLTVTERGRHWYLRGPDQDLMGGVMTAPHNTDMHSLNAGASLLVAERLRRLMRD